MRTTFQTTWEEQWTIEHVATLPRSNRPVWTVTFRQSAPRLCSAPILPHAKVTPIALSPAEDNYDRRTIGFFPVSRQLRMRYSLNRPSRSDDRGVAEISWIRLSGTFDSSWHQSARQDQLQPSERLCSMLTAQYF